MIARFALVFFLFSFTYMINLPFGILRAKSRRYSLRWFLFIHAPIPLVYLLRVISGLDYHYIPVLVLAAVLGQLMGGKIQT